MTTSASRSVSALFSLAAKSLVCRMNAFISGSPKSLAHLPSNPPPNPLPPATPSRVPRVAPVPRRAPPLLDRPVPGQVAGDQEHVRLVRQPGQVPPVRPGHLRPDVQVTHRSHPDHEIVSSPSGSPTATTCTSLQIS